MTKFLSDKNLRSRLISWFAMVTLLLTLSVTWVLWGFWRTIDWITSWTNPTQFLFGYWYGDLGFGYGYWYWDASWSWAWYYSDNWTDANSWSLLITDWSDLQYVSTIVWTQTAATSLTVQATAALQPAGQNVKVTIPEWTIIVKDDWSAFDTSLLTAADLSVSSVALASWKTPVSAITFGVAWTKLHFSQPVRIDIPVTVSTATINVQIRHFWDTAYWTTWLTNNASATCTNWIPSTISDVATVSWWIATIYTCSASDVAAYTTTVSSWGGGWGGWWWTIKDCNDSNLICQEYPNIPWTYKYYRLPSSAFCSWGNLWATCNPDEDNTTDENWEEVIVWNDEDEYGCIGSAWYTWSESKQECVRAWLEEEEEENIEEEEMNEYLWPKFLDIANSWAKWYISILAEKWVVSWNWGYFYPDLNTTRAEFLKIALKAFGHDYSDVDTSNLTYVDINKDSWQAKVAMKAVSKWFISTFNDRFRPNDSITRIEALKILLNAAWIDTMETDYTTFTDVNVWWMKKYVEKSKALWIVNGQFVNNKLILRPNDNITRAETSKIVVKTMNLN